MYKNPQTSDQARRLREELAKFSLDLPHAKALEVVARMAGARTLHVAQAKNNAGVRIADVARRQAALVMFETLGRFEGNLEGLLDELRAIGKLTESEDYAGADNAYQAVFRAEGAPNLHGRFDLRAEEIPDAFEALATDLAGVLSDAAKAPEDDPVHGLFYEGPMFDWLVEAHGLDEVPEDQRQRYEMTLKQGRSQFFIDIAPKHKEPEELDGKPQLSVIIEVSNGVPTVHLSNALYWDQVLTVFSTEDGLYLRPEGDLTIRTGSPSEEDTPGLARMYAKEVLSLPMVSQMRTRHACIVASNRLADDLPPAGAVAPMQ